jgi:hypothetical protein
MKKIFLVDSPDTVIDENTPYMLVHEDKIECTINEHTGILTFGVGGKFFKGVIDETK